MQIVRKAKAEIEIKTRRLILNIAMGSFKYCRQANPIFDN